MQSGFSSERYEYYESRRSAHMTRCPAYMNMTSGEPFDSKIIEDHASSLEGSTRRNSHLQVEVCIVKYRLSDVKRAQRLMIYLRRNSDRHRGHGCLRSRAVTMPTAFAGPVIPSQEV